MDRRDALIAALEWQLEMGADEAIAEAPIDRFAAPEPQAAPAAAVPPAEARPAPSPGPAPSGPAAGTTDTPEAIAARCTTLDQLHAAMRGWEGTELHLGARSCVFADGVPGARLMLIGEAPGQDEDRKGKPFVGRAGQLLDRMLAAIGLARHAGAPGSGAYITNVLPWRPPGNRTPSDAEIAAFLPFLRRHVALAAPVVVMTLGNTPTRALLATTTGIKRMRGTWRMLEPGGLPLLPSFHPAYLLRQPADKRLAWADLRAVRARLDGRG